MNPYKALLKRIAHAQVEHPVLTVLLIAAITLTFLGGAAKVQTVAALENMMPKDLEEISAFNTLRDAGDGQDMIAVVVELDPESTVPKTDILDYETYRHVKLLSDKLQEETDVLAVYSLSSVLESMAGGPVDEASFDALIHDPRAQAQLLNYVNRARTNTIIIATTDVSANDARMNLLARRIVKDTESVGSPPGLRHRLTGTPIIQQELGKLIARDRSVTQNISTLFVFLIVMLLFGTFTSALVPIIVVMLSVTWLYGTMGYTGLPISTLAGGVAAMVIGIGIDYAIHLMSKYKYERKRGLGIEESVEAAVTDTGMALTGASVATMLAFLAFLTGAMPEMRRFGILMTLGVGYSFLLSIGALPALLVLEERLFYRLRRHLHFGVEGEYFLATRDEACPPGYAPVKEEDEKLDAHVTTKFKVYKRIGNEQRQGKRQEEQRAEGKGRDAMGRKMTARRGAR